jgi:hypothetical protein
MQSSVGLLRCEACSYEVAAWRHSAGASLGLLASLRVLKFGHEFDSRQLPRERAPRERLSGAS